MATDERIRKVLGDFQLRKGEVMTEIKMFGGLCFTINRKMVVGVCKSRYMIRLSDADMAGGLREGSIEPMDFTGKPMKNFAYITPKGCATDAALLSWIEKSAQFVRENMMGKPSKAKKR